MEVRTVADIKLVSRAMKEDWKVTPEDREDTLRQIRILRDTGSPKVQCAAAKFFLDADALNIKQRDEERKRLEAEHARKLQLIELAVKLGLVGDGPAAVGAIASESCQR